MTLTAGTKLGPYEVVGPLGTGGMGEVYRARDTRLERAVAIKILPEQLSNDPVRKQRFEQEAKTISNLNHPHICVLYDVGHQDGLDYLVMECVEGETLAKRLEKGPLPLDQVLKFGAQIADALDKAHRSGVVHRDLKPGNIMLTPTGAKLLDFGLAKPAAAAVSGMTLTAAATQTTPVTQEGTIVGTFQYMSPEQIEGKEVDGRSDIFSLGAVLYEMLTGQRAFPGKSQLSVASAILEKEPAPISSVKPLTPPALDHAIRLCLAKDPEGRWQTARDLALDLKWIADGSSQAGVAVGVPARRTTRERMAWAAAVLFGLAAVALAIGFALREPKPGQPIQLSAEIGADANLYTEFGSSVILSPDGTKLVFVASGSDAKRHIYLRSLDQMQAAMLSGTENARTPFFSPDGQWLGFFADGKLKKIAVQGGVSVTVCDAANSRGGSWSEDDIIIFAPDFRGAFSKVSSGGGAPEALTKLDKEGGEVTQRWPEVLPGGKAILFTSNTHGGNYEDADIMVYSMSSGERKKVLHGGYYPRYVNSGHLVYVHEGTLFAIPFDPKRLEVTGQSVPVLEGVAATPGDGSAHFSVSAEGNLVHVAGHGAFPAVSIYWMDREGKLSPLRETPGDYYSPAFSPDGKRLALQIQGGNKYDIWVDEWERDTLTRLTFGDDERNYHPVWTPDGLRITFGSTDKSGAMDLYWKRADGTGEAQRLSEDKNGRQLPSSWRPDGKVLASDQVTAGFSRNIVTMTMEGNDKVGWKPGGTQVFLKSPFTQESAVFSPDGRWLAYESYESGIFEIYVRPFPGPGGKWQISTGGGTLPKWSRGGKELLYLSPDNRIMVASYTASGDSFRADKPRLWANVQISDRLGLSNFDVHPDGKRLAVLKAPPGSEAAPVNKVSFIFNFTEELRRKVAGGKN